MGVKMESKIDEVYMKRALELALRGRGRVSPNPLVGAVIVKDGEIVGEGYHQEYGGLHAERNAIASSKVNLEGATMYVSLEPCCHYGKTPPCTEKIIESGIKKVVVGSRDPNPKVYGKGCKILRENGIDVVEDFMREECDSINKVFFKYIKNKEPYILMKYAMTLDGKIATYSGKSKWITGEKSRARVHLDRHIYSAIMVGVNTIIADDPMLNSRLEEIKNLILESDFEKYGIVKNGDFYETKKVTRIICDTNLRTPLNSKVVETAKEYKTIIATASKNFLKIKKYLDKGCQVIVQENTNKIKLKELIKTLGEMNIDSIIIEGGASLNWSAFEEGIVDDLQSYIAGKIFGGENAKSPISGLGVESPNKAFNLNLKSISQYDGDILIESEVIPCLQE